MMTQELPHAGRQDVTELLIEELPLKLEERRQTGILRYGRSLETFNGRDAHQDLAEELLDALQYAKQAELEYEHIVDLLHELYHSVTQQHFVKNHLDDLRRSPDIQNADWKFDVNSTIESIKECDAWLDQVLHDVEQILDL